MSDRESVTRNHNENGLVRAVTEVQDSEDGICFLILTCVAHGVEVMWMSFGFEDVR